VPASVRQEHVDKGDPLPAVVPPGPDNPLGRHVLKLDLPGYLIHGTNQPYGVGMRVSHGCVRLYPENIEALFELVDVGEPVVIVNEPFLAGQLNGVTYFEAHAPLADDPIPSDQRLADVLAVVENGQGGAVTAVELDLLKSTAKASLGVPVRITSAADDDLIARARVVHNTVTEDPNMPTLAEVRELLDAPVEGEDSIGQVVVDDAGQGGSDDNDDVGADDAGQVAADE
jgi:L,D-transpeptidase ErfK/SrfK